MKSGKVYAAVLNYNGRENTGELYLECIESLLRQKGIDLKTVLIDNSSSDISVEEVSSRFKDIEIILNPRNEATMGYNRAIEAFLSSDREYLLLCNNDMIFEPDFITNMISYSDKHESAGFFTPRMMMLSEKNRYNSTGIVMNCSGYAWDRDFGKDVRIVGVRESGSVFAASGGALFMTKTAAEKAGLFDPIYHAYYEDVDLSLRLRKVSDLDIHYVSDAVCYHSFSMSWSRRSALKEYYMMRNRFLLVMIHFPLRMMIWALRFLIFTSSTGNPRDDRRAYFELIAMKPGIILRRIKYSFLSKKFPKELLEKYHGLPRL